MLVLLVITYSAFIDRPPAVCIGQVVSLFTVVPWSQQSNRYKTNKVKGMETAKLTLWNHCIQNNKYQNKVWLLSKKLSEDYGLKSIHSVIGMCRHGTNHQPDVKVDWMVFKCKHATAKIILCHQDSTVYWRINIDSDFICDTTSPQTHT